MCRRWRRDVAAGVVEDTIYVMGGADHPHSGPITIYATNLAYNPLTAEWGARASLPSPRYHAEAVVIGGYIYLIGGRSVQDGPVVREILRYCPREDGWETAGVLPDAMARADMQAVRLGDKVYLLGGRYPETGTIVSRADVIEVDSLRRGDVDEDGMPDAWELRHFGSTGTASGGTDTDGDGFPDTSEYVARTCPTNSNDYLKIDECTVSPNPGVVMYWNTSTGRIYTIYSATNLFSTWAGVYRTAGNGLEKSYTNTGTEAASRFFRIGVQRQE